MTILLKHRMEYGVESFNHFIRQVSIKRLLTSICLLCMTSVVAGCSMCKITHDGNTYVGNNEDAWGTHARLWFVPGQEATYGAVYLEHSKERSIQGGMNEAGLVFDVFRVSPKESDNQRFFQNRTEAIMQLMEQCATVHDVKAYLEKADSRYSPIAMFWFIDAKGQTLIMEPDSLILGNDPYSALVNCRPTEYADYNEVPITRYHKAMEILNQGTKSGAAYCTRIMESMAACRGSLGEGTLYTTIYDLASKDIHVYFYHDFKTSVTFNLLAELKKGEHQISLPELFPENDEYLALLAYKTPFNSEFVRAGLFALLLLIIPLSLILIFNIVSRQMKGRLHNALHSYLTLVIVLTLNLMAVIHTVILLLREPVFYFGIAGQLAEFPFPQVVYSPLIIALGVLGFLFWWGFNGLKMKSIRRVGIPLKLNIMVLLVLSLMNVYWHLMIP